MKYFFNKIAFFIVAIIIGIIALEVFYRITPNTYTFKIKQLNKNLTDTEVLILGNSHNFYGLNPSYFAYKTFNLANVSQSLYFDELLLNRYIEQLPKLKCVILNVSYTSLTYKVNTSEDKWRKYFYQNQMDLEVPIVSSLDPRKYLLSLSRPLKSSLQTISQYVNDNTLIGCDSVGWGNTYLYNNRSLFISEQAVKTYKKHEDFSVDFKDNLNRITSIIQSCKNRGIKVLLLSMPVSDSYLSKLNSDKLINIINELQLIDLKYNNVYYLNLYFNKNFPENLFYDPDHLNDFGAKKCSQIVDDFIQLKVLK